MIILFEGTNKLRNAKPLCSCNQNGWRIRPGFAETGTHATNNQQKTETVTQ